MSGRAKPWKPVAISACMVCLAAWLAPTPQSLPGLVILALTLSAVFCGPRAGSIPSHVWGPVVGAALVVGCSYLPGVGLPPMTVTVLSAELASHLAVPVLILALAYLSISLDESGFFDWCAVQIVQRSGGSGHRLLIYVFVGISVLTFLTSNDIVILSMTPILIHLGRRARIQNLIPLLMAQFIAANTASMGLYIGNPTNIVIGGAAGLGFLDYARRMFVPTVVAVMTALLMTWLIFGVLSRRNRIVDRYQLPSASDAVGWTRRMSISVALFGSCLVSLAAVSNPWAIERLVGSGDTEHLSRWITRSIVGISFTFALLAALHDGLRDHLRGRRSLRAAFARRVLRLPIEIVPFFLCFCVILRGLEDAGLTESLAESVRTAFDSGPVWGAVVTGFAGIVAVNALNNIPATVLFEKIWSGDSPGGESMAGLSDALDPAHADVFLECSLFASNFGANLTFMGALAGLIWLRIIGRHADGHRVPGPRNFLFYGLLIVPAVTLATCLAIGLLSS